MDVPDEFCYLWNIQRDFGSLLNSFGQGDLTNFLGLNFTSFFGL